MLRIRCTRCNNKLHVSSEDIALSALYQCPYCSWVIDLDKVKSMGRTILIASGKGGVGKSFTAANLAIALSRQGKKVVVIDANLGLSNQHILMNINSPYNLFHYIKEEKSLDEVKVSTNWNVDLIKGSAEIHQISKLKFFEQKMVLDKVLSLESDYDFTIIDMPTGIHENTKFYFRIAKEVIILTTVNITSISDTFRVIKAIKTLNNKIKIGLVVNIVKTKTEADNIFDELANFCFKFYDVFIHSFGFIFDNQYVDLSIQERIPLIILKPECNVSRCISKISARILGDEKLHTYSDYRTDKDREELIKTFKHPPFLFLPEKSSNERRIAIRKNIHERLLYSYIDTSEYNANPCRGPGISENISSSGILFKSTDQIPKTKHLLLTFNFNGGKPDRISGKVIHNDMIDDKNRNLIGVAFNRFFGSSKEFLDQIISNHP